jgi:hypothetical protein
MLAINTEGIHMVSYARTFREVNFGNAVLGDLRRTRRWASVADQMVHRLGGSLPKKINSPKALQALY